MGGDRAPEEVVAGALEARGATTSSRSSSARRRSTPRGLELVETTRADRDGREARRGRPREAEQLARRGVPRGRRRATPTPSSRRGTRARCSPPALLEIRRLRACMRPAIAVVIPARCGASVLIDAGRERRRRGPSTCSSSRTWARSSPRRSSSVPNPEVRLLSIGEEAGEGQPARRSRRTRCSRRAGSTSGQRGEPRAARGRGGRGRHRRFHRQRRAEAARGDDPGAPRRAARRRSRATTRGKLGGLLIRPAARRLRAGSIRRPTAAPTCSACAGSSVIAHGNSSRLAIANAIRLAARGVEHGVVAARRASRRAPEDRGSIARPQTSDDQDEVTWQRRAKKSSSE